MFYRSKCTYLFWLTIRHSLPSGSLKKEETLPSSETLTATCLFFILKAFSTGMSCPYLLFFYNMTYSLSRYILSIRALSFTIVISRLVSMLSKHLLMSRVE